MRFSTVTVTASAGLTAAILACANPALAEDFTFRIENLRRVNWTMSTEFRDFDVLNKRFSFAVTRPGGTALPDDLGNPDNPETVTTTAGNKSR